MITHTSGSETAVLSGFVNRALARFHRLTGMEAVASINLAPASPTRLSPPLHHLCASRIRNAVRPPCDTEWRKHLSRLADQRHSHQHLCRLGLRCGVVPVVYRGQVVGVAKCVCGRDTPLKKFANAIELLEVLVTGSSSDLELLEMREKMTVLERTLALDSRFERIQASRNKSAANGNELVAELLRYLEAHYREPDLDLARVAAAVGRSEKYIAHLFVKQLGTRMRAYINNLRVCHARDLLLDTSGTVEQIAEATGFSSAGRFREVFRREIGVTPSRYRDVYAACARHRA